jgi:hypothetical protein
LSVSANPSRIALDWPHETAYGAVGRLVLSGVASRLDLSVERVDDLGLALETLMRGPVTDGRLHLEVDVVPGELRASVGAFVTDPLADPAIKRIVAALVGDVETVSDLGGHRVVLTIPAPG